MPIYSRYTDEDIIRMLEFVVEYRFRGRGFLIYCRNLKGNKFCFSPMKHFMYSYEADFKQYWLLAENKDDVLFLIIQTKRNIPVRCNPYISSWKSSKEGDLPLCNLPKREILRETGIHTFCDINSVHQHSNFG